MAALKTIGKLQKIGSALSRVVATPPPGATAQGRPPPELDKPVIRSRGPEVLGLGLGRKQPGVPAKPTDFEGSIPEWVWYYISGRVIKETSPGYLFAPYAGDPNGIWAFQVPELPGEPRQVGNSISDFVYYMGTGEIIVRIEGFIWHTAAPPANQARDAYLTSTAASQGTRVERVEDGEYMDDMTGGKAGSVARRHPLRLRPHWGYPRRTGRATQIRAVWGGIMKYGFHILKIPEATPLSGISVAVRQISDGTTLTSGTTDDDGYVSFTADGHYPPFYLYVTGVAGGDKYWRSDEHHGAGHSPSPRFPTRCGRWATVLSADTSTASPRR